MLGLCTRRADYRYDEQPRDDCHSTLSQPTGIRPLIWQQVLSPVHYDFRSRLARTCTAGVTSCRCLARLISLHRAGFEGLWRIQRLRQARRLRPGTRSRGHV